jgi:hypothetical protein
VAVCLSSCLESDNPGSTAATVPLPMHGPAATRFRRTRRRSLRHDVVAFRGLPERTASELPLYRAELTGKVPDYTDAFGYPTSHALTPKTAS